ncbi:hypothetical protein MtrunA17_Chr1g0146131 [Medicago truncatula]|uniref:Transmembrane protein n=1 Tax=Medicago truncatula TaxID=3880 RepID=A0A396JHM0_MEDTR|nr:hypothetical protein MtrunA17_Chr1g0146131 [Medicago truncatula]
MIFLNPSHSHIHVLILGGLCTFVLVVQFSGIMHGAKIQNDWLLVKGGKVSRIMHSSTIITHESKLTT